METNINWQKYTEETVKHLSDLIKINTVNPPGNEIRAIQYIQKVLLDAGFPPEDIHILESAPGRANLIARLRGDGSGKPILLSGHVDVVMVEPDKWTHDPFGGEVEAGYVWGRGALDMKGFLAMYLQIFLQAFRQKTPLKRDLILAAIADEEAGFTHGSKFLVSQHKELINAEYGITEGGAFTIYFGNSKAYLIQAAEKGVCWLRMTASGKPGHGSLPHSENAVFFLAQAIEKIHQAQHLPVHVTPTFKAMLHAAGNQMKFPAKLLPGMMTNSAIINLAMRNLSGRSLTLLTALTTNTCTPTVLSAGAKTNVIPGIAEVQLDCRKLPGQSPDDVIREIKAITGDLVTLEPIEVSDGNESSTSTPFYQMMEKVTREMDPDGMVLPLMMPGATDATIYAKAGIQVYGFTPGILPQGYPVMDLGHGHDERLPISYIQTGLPALWKLITQFCT